MDVSKVDPENCDTAEMYAYTANLKESGKGSFEDTVLKAAEEVLSIINVTHYCQRSPSSL